MENFLKQYQLIAKEKHLVAIFDRDGTLAPITSQPKDSKVSPQFLQLLTILAKQKNVTVVILSARGLKSLQCEFDRQDFVLAGNYGLEIQLFGQYIVNPLAHSYSSRLKQIKALLETLLSSSWQTILDDHELSLCLHWHLTPNVFRADVAEAVQSVQRSYPDVQVRGLPTSYEFLPPLNWDKSKALDLINAAIGDADDCFYFYAGDSVSDEPAFAWINEHNGLSIKIGQPNVTSAQHAIEQINDLQTIVQEVLKTRQETNMSSARKLPD